MLPIILLCGEAGSGKDTLARFLSKRLYNSEIIAIADPMKRLALQVFQFSEASLWGPSEGRRLVQPELAYTNLRRWGYALDRLSGYGNKWITEILPHASDAKRREAMDRLVAWFIHTRDLHLASEEPNPTPRYVLQTIGTEWGRAVASNIWSAVVLDTAQRLLEGRWSYSPSDGLCICPEATGCDWVIISDGRMRNEVIATRAAGGTTILVETPATSELEGGVRGHRSERELSSIPLHFFTDQLHNDKSLGLDVLRDNARYLSRALYEASKPRRWA